MQKRCLIFFLILLLVPALAAAQEAEPTETGLNYGLQVSGRLNNAEPRAVYVFDGMRGEVVSITLSATSGDLDPVLTILDSSGTVIANRDDSDGTRNVKLNSLHVPHSDRYYIVVGRFGYGLGTTSGDYTLDLERIGVSSASGSALRFGDSVTNTITNMTPQLFYSFRAEQGQIVNIRMQRVSGDLDTYLQVVNSNALVIGENDDVPGSGSLDAIIDNLVVEETGTYVIIASRFGQAAGSSTGTFVLSLNEAANSGLGNSAQTAANIAPGDTVEGELTNDSYTRYYRFQARQNDIITARMERLSGSVDSFLVLADVNLIEMASDDDGGGGQNAQIGGYLIPADGTYYLLATRYQREAGTTAGRFRLSLSSEGNAFDSVPEGVQRLSYGTTITGTIDDTTPEVLYAFWGVKGDTITVSMNRGDGNLDSYLTLLDGSQQARAQDDDSGGEQNARIERYQLQNTGVYYIRAARYSGTDGRPTTHGSYILVLARRFD